MEWKVGQTVMVQSRTWPGINKPGGCATIVRIHTNKTYDDEDPYIEGLDVKYVVSGQTDKNLDPAIVEPYQSLERGGRSRRKPTLLESAKEPPKKKTPAKSKAKSDRDTADRSGEKKAKLIPSAATGKENQHRKDYSKKEPVSSATCSSPEPPSRHRTKKRPTKVTPTIPKMVVVPNHNNSEVVVDDVSPMWVMDAVGGQPRRKSDPSNKHHPNSSDRKPSTAARGLNFETTPQKQIPGGKKSLGASKKRTESLPPTRLSSKPIFSSSSRQPPSKPVSGLHHRGDTSKETSKKRRLPDSGITSQRKPFPTTYAGPLRQQYSTPGSGYRSSAAVAPRRNPLPSRFTAEPRPAKPRAKTVASMTDTGHRRSLKEVYEQEREMALRFMGEMTGGKSFDDPGSPKKPSRYEEFLSHLSRVWMRVDGEDEISEDCFKTVYHEITGGSFSTDEVEKYLAALCEEGKEVMACDGILYRIN